MKYVWIFLALAFLGVLILELIKKGTFNNLTLLWAVVCITNWDIENLKKKKG